MLYSGPVAALPASTTRGNNLAPRPVFSSGSQFYNFITEFQQLHNRNAVQWNGARKTREESKTQRCWRQTLKTIELNKFRKTLKTRQAELSDGRRNRDALAIETSADELDRIQQAQERDFAMGSIDRDSLRLREIRAALERIDNGSFGICLNCEEEIAAKRLAAVPWTALCIVCQEAADRMASDRQDEDEQALPNAA